MHKLHLCGSSWPPQNRAVKSSVPCSQQSKLRITFTARASTGSLAAQYACLHSSPISSSAFHVPSQEASKTSPRISSAHCEVGWGKRAANIAFPTFKLQLSSPSSVSLFDKRWAWRCGKRIGTWGEQNHSGPPCNNSLGKCLTHCCPWVVALDLGQGAGNFVVSLPHSICGPLVMNNKCSKGSPIKSSCYRDKLSSPNIPVTRCRYMS